MQREGPSILEFAPASDSIRERILCISKLESTEKSYSKNKALSIINRIRSMERLSFAVIAIRKGIIKGIVQSGK